MRRCVSLLSPVLALLFAGCSAGSITVPRYVLSYGIGDYLPVGVNPGDLNSPPIDAQAMRDLLVLDGYTDLGMRIDSSATSANIQSDIVGLSSLEDDAIIVIFYSSHGTSNIDNSVAYLVPYDAVDEAGEITASTAEHLISPYDLNDWIAQSGKRNVIVIINACFSGGFVDPGSSIDIAPQNYGPNDDGTTPSRLWSAIGSFGTLLSRNAGDSGSPGPIVISAAGSDEVSYELAEGSSGMFDDHGIFPYFILRAAEAGDADDDGFVTATEAYSYAVNGIKLNWNLYEQGYYDSSTGTYADFMPHISGGARDLVLFSN